MAEKTVPEIPLEMSIDLLPPAPPPPMSFPMDFNQIFPSRQYSTWAIALVILQLSLNKYWRIFNWQKIKIKQPPP